MSDAPHDRPITRHTRDVTETEIPQHVGGYRVGRNTGPSRYLGHIASPAVVELVFVDHLSATERESVMSDALDVASLSSGGRVAIVSRPTEQVPATRRLSLETPPELASAWEEMRRAVTYPDTEAGIPSLSDASLGNQSRTFVAWVRSRMATARRGPVVVAGIAGVLVVIMAIVLIPGAGDRVSGDQVSGDQVSTSLPTNESAPEIAADSQRMGLGDVGAPEAPDEAQGQPTLAPQSVVGDIALVALPPREASGVNGAEQPQYAVLERDGDTWLLRDVY